MLTYIVSNIHDRCDSPMSRMRAITQSTHVTVLNFAGVNERSSLRLLLNDSTIVRHPLWRTLPEYYCAWSSKTTATSWRISSQASLRTTATVLLSLTWQKTKVSRLWTDNTSLIVSICRHNKVIKWWIMWYLAKFSLLALYHSASIGPRLHLDLLNACPLRDTSRPSMSLSYTQSAHVTSELILLSSICGLECCLDHRSVHDVH